MTWIIPDGGGTYSRCENHRRGLRVPGCCSPECCKTMIFTCDGEPVSVLVRGDEDINEAKLRNYLGCDSLELAMNDIILEITGSPRGFAGPMGIKSRIIADYSLMNMKNFVVGSQ